MRKVLLTAATAACAAALTVLLSACKADDTGHKASAPPSNAATQSSKATATTPEATRRTTVAELQQLMQSGEAVVVDVRTKEQYEQAHIKGAILMPLAEVATRFSELPRDKQIVFYCA